MCLHCTGYDRERIDTCKCLLCPLWEYRPRSRGFTGILDTPDIVQTPAEAYSAPENQKMLDTGIQTQ
jgi:hypothetical protein